MSVWSGWTPCSNTCGGGERYRARTVLRNPEHGGAACAELLTSLTCNTHACGTEPEAAAVGDGAPMCPPAPQIPNAAVVTTGLSDGARATYTCALNYKLNGWDHADCWCTAAACHWTSPPNCVTSDLPHNHNSVTPAPTPKLAHGTCNCDPEVDVATDVKCVLEEHKCKYFGDQCDHVKVHKSIRVEHIKHVTYALTGDNWMRHTTRTHPPKHHKCKMVGPFDRQSCKCCDCHLQHKTDEGCPCGSKHHFFGKRWQYGTSKYWWVFRPKPGTKTCEVRGEMIREGTNADAGDMYLSGHVTVDMYGHLHLDAKWTEPSDPECPALADGANVFEKLEMVAPLKRYHCGSMKFGIYHKMPELATVSADWIATVGQKVLALRGPDFHRSRWYKATISAIHNDGPHAGTFDVKYDDVHAWNGEVIDGTGYNVEKQYVKKNDNPDADVEPVDTLTGTWAYVTHAGSAWNINWSPCGSGAGGTGTLCSDANTGPLMAESEGGACPIDMVR